MPAREPSRRTIKCSELARSLGVTPRRARAYWAQPRDQYEAQAVSRQAAVGGRGHFAQHLVYAPSPSTIKKDHLAQREEFTDLARSKERSSRRSAQRA